MKKKLTAVMLLLCITVSMFAGCGSSSSVAPEPVSRDQKYEALATRHRVDYQDLYKVRLWADSSIQSNVQKAKSNAPEDDFNIAVNGEWILSNSIPEGYTSYDTFSERQFEVDDQMKLLFEEELITEDESLMHDMELSKKLYELWLDWDGRNEVGAAPYIELLEPVAKISSLSEMTEWLSRKRAATLTATPVTCYSGIDWNNAERYTVYVDSSSLIFGDSMYYQYMDYDDWKDEPYYSEAAVYMMQRLGYSERDAKKLVENCFAFEKDMADYIMTTEQLGAGDAIKKQNNVYTMSEMQELAGPFPIKESLEAYGFGNSDTYILSEPKWLARLGELYKKDKLEEMKAYIIVSTMMIWWDSVDREAYVKVNDVLNSIHGTEGMIPDETAAIKAVEDNIPMALGHLYCDRFVDEETKSDVTAITREIIAQYKEMFMEETFVSDETREGAIRKLDNMAIRIAYPDKWEDNSDLTYLGKDEGGTLFAANEAIADSIWFSQSEAVGQPVDDEVWTFSPQQVNACYDPTDNSITICGGILGGEFYSNDMTHEQMLGTIGAIIAHEISHSFDSSGRRFDEEGNLNNWWTAWDAKVFDRRTDKLIAYYDSIMPFKGLHCSGTLVQTEAIADLTAMKCILYIAKDVSGFDYEEMFESFATLWRMVSLEDTEYYLAYQDTHPLSYLRTNVVVQQFQEFYDTYGVSEGDGMYLAPGSRLVIW